MPPRPHHPRERTEVRVPGSRRGGALVPIHSRSRHRRRSVGVLIDSGGSLVNGQTVVL